MEAYVFKTSEEIEMARVSFKAGQDLEAAHKAGMMKVVECVESIIPLINEGMYGELWQAFLKDNGLERKV